MWHRWGFLNVQWTVETVTIFHEFFTFLQLSYWPLSLFLFVSVGASTALIIRRSSQVMELQTQRQRPLKAKGQTLRTPWRFKSNTEASMGRCCFIFSTISTELSDNFMMLGFIFLLFWFLFVFCHPIYLHVTLFQHFPCFISVSLFFHCCSFPDLTLSVVCVQVHLPTWCGKLIMSHLKCSASWLHNRKGETTKHFFISSQ